MKKFLTFLLVFLMISSVACAEEITFRGIPWNTDPHGVIKLMGWDVALIEENQIMEEMGKTPQTDDLMVRYFLNNEVSDVGYFAFDDKIYGENCGYVFSDYYFRRGDMIVAEHDVSEIELEFLYGMENGKVDMEYQSSKFVKATYSFWGGEISIFDDLLDKLTWLYGEPFDYIENINDYPSSKSKEVSVVWYGDNDTILHLYLRATGEYSKEQYEYVYTIKTLDLEYGLRTIGEQIKLIETAQQIQERNEMYDTENTDGL